MTARQPADKKVRCQSLIDGVYETKHKDPSRRWVFSMRTAMKCSASPSRAWSVIPSGSEKMKKRSCHYVPYHRQFEEAVSRNLQRYGRCLIIDGHSFYDEPLPYEIDRDPNRPDICIGTDEFHTPKEIEEKLRGSLAERGYRVEINRPFAGCIVPARFYRRDKRVLSVMIEINRRLYMDHSLKKTDGYERVKQDIAAAIALLEEGV